MGESVRDLVAIPTYSRPEMLWHCLEHLAACPEAAAGDLDLVVFVDNHVHRPPPLEEIGQVLPRFPGVAVVARAPHAYRGNSFNVMKAYEQGLAEGRERVFLVEDDVMVEPDFFRWHREVQEAEQLFCSIGISRPGVTITTEMFASLGVCFRRGPLELVVGHANVAYFSNMNHYCQRTFRAGPNVGTEQDGLILRVMKQAKGTARFAPQDAPKARHIGWYGYNRGLHGRPAGPLQARYETVAARLTHAVV